MGSYLTLVNNTEVTYECKVGVHESTLAKFMVGFAVVGASFAVMILSVLRVLLKCGNIPVLKPLVTAFSRSAVVWSTFSASGLLGLQLTRVFGQKHRLDSIRMTMQKFDYFNESIVYVLNSELKRKKYFTIESGKSHQYGMMTLGLLRQATCVRNIYISNVSIALEVLLAKPLWSSVIPFKSHKYNLGSWVSKYGVVHNMVYSAKFMEYENKNFSAYPILPLNAIQLLTNNGANHTSLSLMPTKPPNPLVMNNLRPSISIPTSNKEYFSSVPSGSMPNVTSTKPEQEPMTVTMAPIANATGFNGSSSPSISRTYQPPMHTIQSRS